MNTVTTGQEHLPLTTGAVPFDLVLHEGASVLGETLLRIFNDTFPRRNPGQVPELTFILRPFEEFAEANKAQATIPFALRRSSARPFNLDLLLGEETDASLVAFDPATSTGYVIDRPTCCITFFVSEDSLFHLIETIRYTLLVKEQGRGSLILHASAAQEAAGDLVLVLGDKGRGKTTTLLLLLQSERLAYFSGDKVLADMTPTGLRLRAWPDFAHVGIGTFRLFPDLARACGVPLLDAAGQPRPPGEKHLVAPDRFSAALGRRGTLEASRVTHVLFPDVRVEEPARIVPLSEAEQRERFDHMIEDARIFTPGCWHKLAPTKAPADGSAVFDALRPANWCEVPGRGLSFDTLFGRVIA